MQVQASNISVSLDAMLPDKGRLLSKELAVALGIKPVRIQGVRITRRSVDARKKQHVRFVVNALLDIEGIKDIKSLRPKRGVQVQLPSVPEPVAFPDLSALAAGNGQMRPVVVGAGPAGLFCALALARAGLRPLLVERGRPVEDRQRDVDAFARGGALNTRSNIQFGEGGAGTFSDGKLTTGTKSPFARFVLEEFAACGAPEDILVDAKPHIGTDYLPQVVRNLRERIIEAGGEVRFSTQLVAIEQRDLSGDGDDGMIVARLRDLDTGTEEAIGTNALALAIGHSARDTFQMLADAGFGMERKPFAVGVRIEHHQEAVDRAQHGSAAGHPVLPPAEYKLAVHNADGRGVYTFCMCPGGEVAAAASEEGGVCVNGMSNHARDGRNANSALLVEVRPDDLPAEDGVLAGVHLQRQLERAAFEAGGGAYAAPAQTVGAFLGRQRSTSKGARDAREVRPTYPRGVREADLHEVLPAFVAAALEEALPKLGRKLSGFDAPEALMTAVEARSSSPVRILRDDRTLQSVSCRAIYPAGEGAGYAGGIMSAACDGLRVARAIMEDAQISAAAQALRDGRPAAFPTDTVPGVAVAPNAALDAHVLARIKGRDEGKPIAWLVASPEALDAYGQDVPPYARELAAEGWPGALTLVVRANRNVPVAYQSARGTIGLRMPASPTALRLIEAAGSPLATTSANLAGEPAPSSMDDLTPAFVERAHEAGAAFVRARERGSGEASRVMDCTGPEPIILR